MNRWPLVMLQQILLPRDPEAICQAVRLAYGVLVAVMMGAAAWLLYSRI